jgi:Tol biopolymer transport system component
MLIVQADLSTADGTAESLTVLVGDDKAYQAEGSWSADGRHILYCSQESGGGDIYVLDTKTGKKSCIVSAEGYDGGPFFSPDGKRICYRSDRRGDEKLQLFVSDLAFNSEGTIVGVEREYQLTDDGNVNWCPFWTHDGRSLVYSTSALGHTNYEIIMCDADPGNLSGSTGTIKYGTAQRRITNASKADVLPAFSHDGEWMMWTSQRHDLATSQLWVAKFVVDDDKAGLLKLQADAKPQAKETTFTVQDPDTGLYYLYNRETHELTAYDVTTHKTRPVTDPAEREKAEKLFGRAEPN